MSCLSKQPFDFINLWNITQCLNNTNPNDSHLFSAGNGSHPSPYPSLTFDACLHIATQDYHPYDASTIWTRLTTWKFPLLQLVALFPRPPLNLKAEFFVMAHLLGDPIDTIKNLLLKLETCQKATDYWRPSVSNPKMVYQKPVLHRTPNEVGGEGPAVDLQLEDPHEKELRWKALSLLSVAYDEWGQSKQIEILKPLFERFEDKGPLWSIVRETAEALAADRATKYLPTVVAELFFIGAIAVALSRTIAAIDTNAFNQTIFISLEVHSIAFTTLYFWIIPTVFLGSIIGVSQTEARIPRILNRFQRDVRKHFEESGIDFPGFQEEMVKLKTRVESKEDRLFHGGIYSWQPSNWQYGAVQQSEPAQPAQNGSDESLPPNPQPDDTTEYILAQEQLENVNREPSIELATLDSKVNSPLLQSGPPQDSGGQARSSDLQSDTLQDYRRMARIMRLPGFAGPFSAGPSSPAPAQRSYIDRRQAPEPDTQPLGAQSDSPQSQIPQLPVSRTVSSTRPPSTCPNPPSKFKYWLRHHQPIPYLIVIIPTITSCLLSGYVPPDGWDCRVTGEICVLAAWLLSAELDIVFNYFLPLCPELREGEELDPVGLNGECGDPKVSENVNGKGKGEEEDATTENQETRRLTKRRTILWRTMYMKDLLTTIGTIIWIVCTIVGVLNRCSCWTLWGTTGLTLPQRPDVDVLLRRRLKREYPAIIFTGLGIELLVFPLWMLLWYRDALKVFVQRDDGESNFKWLWEGWANMRAWGPRYWENLKRWGKRKARKMPTWEILMNDGRNGLTMGM